MWTSVRQVLHKFFHYSSARGVVSDNLFVQEDRYERSSGAHSTSSRIKEIGTWPRRQRRRARRRRARSLRKSPDLDARRPPSRCDGTPLVLSSCQADVKDRSISRRRGTRNGPAVVFVTRLLVAQASLPLELRAAAEAL